MHKPKRFRCDMSGEKSFETLVARAALAGRTCKHTDAGYIVLGQFGGAWIFDTVDQANAWLDRMPQPSTEVPA